MTQNSKPILAPPAPGSEQLPMPSGKMPAGVPNVMRKPVPPPQAPPPGQLGPDGKPIGFGVTDTEPTPEEQQDYDQLMTNFATYVYKDGQEAVLRSINNPDKPVYINIAGTQFTIMNEMVSMAESSRKEPLSPDTIFHAAVEQVEILMDLGDMAGIFPFEQGDEEYVKTQDLAFTESQRLLGEGLLGSPDAEMHKEDASNYAAEQISREADAGELHPQYQEGIAGMMAQSQAAAQQQQTPVAQGPQQTPVAQGVGKALRG